MAGVISLSHPVPQLSDGSDDASPIPNGAKKSVTKITLDSLPDNIVTTPLKHTGHKGANIRRFQFVKSHSAPLSVTSPENENEKENKNKPNTNDKDTEHSHSHSMSHSHAHSHKSHKIDTTNLPSFHGLRPCYRPSVYKKDYKNVLKEIIAGIIVSFAQVPESISFAMLASLPPIFGLHSAWLIGGIVALTGGRPGMISGATGGMGAILGPIMSDPNLGINYLPYIIIFSGVLVTVCGICGIGKFARLIPQTVMIGFLNGLAIIILKSQFHLYHHAHGWQDYLASTALALITFCVVQFLPKLTKLIPSSLAAILVATGIEYLIIRMAIGHHTPLIGEMSEIEGDLPQPFWHDTHDYFDALPSLGDGETWEKLILPIILVTLVSIIEDAMTMDVVTELTHTKCKHLERHTKQQEIAMGIANVVGGLLSTMGGHGAIGLSMVSCHSGSTGVYRVSGLTASVLVFIIVMFASPLIDMIPYAALVGIMLAVVGHTFEWRSIPMVISATLPRKLRHKLPNFMRGTKINRGDALVIVLVTIFVVTVNLAYAVLLGIVITSLIYTWYSGFSFHVHKEYVHIAHLRDKRQIRKFSDFHIHYHNRHTREHSRETIESLDPHFHPLGHDDGHNRSYSDLRVGGHSYGQELVKTASFSADNRFTELHEIRDIDHLDTFMSGAGMHHMESLKEAKNPADELPTPKAKDLKPDDANVLKPMFLSDLDNIKSINDTFRSVRTEGTDENEQNNKKAIPTFEAGTSSIGLHQTRSLPHGVEHGTLRSLKTFNKIEYAEHKLSDDETDSHKGKLSDCTNPEDIASFVENKFHKDYILVYHFEGPLFFGNCRNLLSEFDPKEDPEHIEIHLRDACIYDFSAMNALNLVGEEYDNLGKTVHLRHINDKSHKLIAKANHLVKYFSYDDVVNAHGEPKNRNRMNVLSNDNSVTNGHGEREISRSQSLLQLGTPNQYRFRMNTRHV